jgi:hypothetical protein
MGDLDQPLRPGLGNGAERGQRRGVGCNQVLRGQKSPAGRYRNLNARRGPVLPAFDHQSRPEGWRDRRWPTLESVLDESEMRDVQLRLALHPDQAGSELPRRPDAQDHAPRSYGGSAGNGGAAN